MRLPGYNGLNKTISSRTSIHAHSLRAIAGFGNTTPIDAFKNGDFSRLLTGRRLVWMRWGGRSSKADLRSRTTREVNGISVRDPFPNNVIPANTRCAAGGVAGHSADGPAGP